jgi:Cellulose biosynthesis protein BcsS
MSALVVGAMRARSGVAFDSVRSSITGGGALLLAAVVALTANLASQPSAAAEPDQPQHGWREVWGGVDASSNVWLLYGGVTIAPWSTDIYSDGWRLRTTGGFGRYSYKVHPKQPTGCGVAGTDQCPATKPPKRIDVTHTYVDALVGYQQRFGELTAKTFVGVAYVEHALSSSDTDNKVSGDDIGVKAMLELWLNLGSSAWTSLDLNYTTAHETGAARWRAGWRVLPTVSIGPELRYDRNTEDDASRAAVFARYDWFGGEASIAAGVAGDMTGGDTNDLEPYATFNLLYQY